MSIMKKLLFIFILLITVNSYAVNNILIAHTRTPIVVPPAGLCNNNQLVQEASLDLYPLFGYNLGELFSIFDGPDDDKIYIWSSSITPNKYKWIQIQKSTLTLLSSKSSGQNQYSSRFNWDMDTDSRRAFVSTRNNSTTRTINYNLNDFSKSSQITLFNSYPPSYPYVGFISAAIADPDTNIIYFVGYIDYYPPTGDKILLIEKMDDVNNIDLGKMYFAVDSKVSGQVALALSKNRHTLYIAPISTDSTVLPVYKVDINTFTYSGDTSATFTKNDMWRALVIDSKNSLYINTGFGSGTVVKVDLDTETQVDSVTVPNVSTNTRTPQNTFEYDDVNNKIYAAFAKSGNSGVILARINPDSMTVEATLNLTGGGNYPNAEELDIVNQEFYVTGISQFSNSRYVTKISLCAD